MTVASWRVLRGQHSVERERQQKAQRARNRDRLQSIGLALVIVAAAFVMWATR